MAVLVTAHSTKPGYEEQYESFLKQRKIGFVRRLPGITAYRVYRTEQRFPVAEGHEEQVRYNIMAIIEYDGNTEELLALYTSPE